MSARRAASSELHRRSVRGLPWTRGRAGRRTGAHTGGSGAGTEGGAHTEGRGPGGRRASGAGSGCRQGEQRPRGRKQAVTTVGGGGAARGTSTAEAATHGAERERQGGERAGRACRTAHGQGVGAGARRARQAWDRVVTCSGPVNAQPKGLLGHAYEIGGSTEVPAPVALGHIGQTEPCVSLHSLTDPGLRGQETRLRRACGSPAGHRVATQESRPRHGGGPAPQGSTMGSGRPPPQERWAVPAAGRRRGGASWPRAAVPAHAPRPHPAPLRCGPRGWRSACPPLGSWPGDAAG